MADPKIHERFEILRELGQGGMGRVLLARDRATNREVALKTLREEFASNTRVRRRFDREVRVLSSLRHPHIIQVNQCGLTARPPWFCMEFCQAGAVIPDIEAGSSKQIISLFLQACEGVAHAHENGIIHRDLKPGNLLMGDDGLVKVADFGLAVRVDRDTTALTKSGTALGTFPYMAPEQIANAKRVTAGTDIYSLGVTLFVWLTGMLPAADAKRRKMRFRDLDPEEERQVFNTIEICMRGPRDHRFYGVWQVIRELKPFASRARAFNPDVTRDRFSFNEASAPTEERTEEIGTSKIDG